MRLSCALFPSTAAGLAAGLTWSPPGSADSIVSASPGITFSVSLGDKPVFGLGVDLRMTVLLQGAFSGCPYFSPAGLGPFVQATWLNFSRAGRFAAGVHGGGAIHPIYSLDGEIGWTYRTSLGEKHRGGHGIHLGLLNSFYPAEEFSVRTAISWFGPKIVPEAILGLGPRFPPPFGTAFGGCVDGRPLRTKDGVVLPPALVAGRRRGRALPVDETARAALAAAWLGAARAECASIPAFLALARDLAALGAPQDLLRGALAAARDELHHTAICTARAGDYARAHIALLLLEPPPATGGDRASELLRLAVESWRDGCLGEGAAATRARRALRNASDPLARAALARITRDEERHAELGLRVLAYCLDEGGPAVRDAIAAEVLAPEPAPPEAEAAHDDAAWSAHGRLEPSAADAAWAETWTHARRAAAIRTCRSRTYRRPARAWPNAYV